MADDNRTLLQAAVAGLGVALLLPTSRLRQSRPVSLEILLPGYAPQENWFKAYVPRRRMGVQRVKALLTYLQDYWVT